MNINLVEAGPRGLSQHELIYSPTIPEATHPEIKVSAGGVPLEPSLSFWWHHWLVNSALLSPPWSLTGLLGLCVSHLLPLSVIRTAVIGFRARPKSGMLSSQDPTFSYV